ncbi:hypothetical protein RISK_004785 [Rhodopirellula islandica]|uniref:Uncharacterized protein n=1 Tax=Rhodopirellula islandica TaxID=595434 RepID=A0A0J1B9J5_RHOIS|nr:hypothetical protein RISK_004785 [Rhodopirellula islandica]
MAERPQKRPSDGLREPKCPDERWSQASRDGLVPLRERSPTHPITPAN